MKRKWYSLAPALFFLVAGAFGQADGRFQQANDAFQKNDFKKAIQLYEQLADAGYASPELEYNLGNAWYRLDSPGRAILHYERASLLAPGDKDIRYNLNLVRRQLEDEIEPLPEFFLSHWWKKGRMALSSTAWGAVALALSWAGFIGLILWQLGKTRETRKKGFLAGLILLVLGVLPFSLALSRLSFEKNTGQAIVLEKTASLRSAPDEAGTEIFLLHEGAKVSLSEQLSGWWKVRLANGETGWLEAKVMEKIQ